MIGALLLAACGGSSPAVPGGADEAPLPTDEDRSGGFWDLSPDTGWMADYPVVDCPWPDEDDLVVELKTYALVSDFYGDGHILYIDGWSIGSGDCAEEHEIRADLTSGARDGFHFNVWHELSAFAPGMYEGPLYLPGVSSNSPFALDYWKDGELYWLYMSNSAYPWYEGGLSYQSHCIVRMRPHRIAGMWRFEAPPADRIQPSDIADWPEELLGGVYVYWDIWRGKDVNSVYDIPCMHVFYEHGAIPEEVWPEMPPGWSVEDTVQ